MTLPQLTATRPLMTDGGLETTLVYLDGIDLPDFATTSMSMPCSTASSTGEPCSPAAPRQLDDAQARAAPHVCGRVGRRCHHVTYRGRLPD